MTVPEIWTYAVPVMITAERDESALSYTHEQRADQDEDDEESPTTPTPTRRAGADWCP